MAKTTKRPKIIRRPLSYYEKRDYIIDDEFFREYRKELKLPKGLKRRYG